MLNHLITSMISIVSIFIVMSLLRAVSPYEAMRKECVRNCIEKVNKVNMEVIGCKE